MRILWATPLAASSAVGRFSRDLCETLTRMGCEVTIARTETPAYAAALTHRTTLPTLWVGKLAPHLVRADYDAAILNIGNHYGYHAGIFPLLEARCCTGFFHSEVLLDLVRERGASQGNATDVVRAAMEESYGPSVVTTLGLSDISDLAATPRDADFSERVAQHAPLTEWFAARCIGAISHREGYLPRLQAACPGPSTHMSDALGLKAFLGHVAAASPGVEMRSRVEGLVKGLGLGGDTTAFAQLYPALEAFSSAMDRG